MMLEVLPWHIIPSFTSVHRFYLSSHVITYCRSFIDLFECHTQCISLESTVLTTSWMLSWPNFLSVDVVLLVVVLPVVGDDLFKLSDSVTSSGNCLPLVTE